MDRLTYKTNGKYSNIMNDDIISDKLGQLEDILEKYAITDIEQLDNRLEESVRDFTYLGYGKRQVKDYYDIEQELGIDLITLFKALKNGIWTKERWYIGSCLSLSNGNLGLYINELDRLFLFKDYGKTWSLRKEDLENE